MLLRDIGDRGYPSEYLLSRIKGRRGSLVTDWKSFILSHDLIECLPVIPSKYKFSVSDRSAEVFWEFFLKEVLWVYHQMDSGLRALFRPFFAYIELRTVFICLRHKAGKKEERIAKLLSFSLLSDKMKGILMGSKNAADAVRGIEAVFIAVSLKFKGLSDVFNKDGLREAERQLTDGYLEYAVNKKPHPVMKAFFVLLIDTRNITAVYKHLRWKVKSPLSFIAGGSIGNARFRQIIESGDISGLEGIIRKLAGVKAESLSGANIERALLRGMMRFLRNTRRVSGVGLIMDYMWRSYIEAINLRTFFYGTEVDREIIDQELIA